MRESKLLWRQRRALALLLTLCLLLTCMPLPALSVNETAACAGEAANASDEVYIVGEDVTKRGEFEKHFLCSDGTYRAVTYAEPVHHYDSAAGAWQDNDVSLALNAASARYEAQSGSFAVSFAKSYAAPGGRRDKRCFRQPDRRRPASHKTPLQPRPPPCRPRKPSQ